MRTARPAWGSGFTPAFTWTVSSPQGYGNIADVYALISGTGAPSGANGCYIHYNPASNLLSVANNSGTGWSSGIVPGTSATTGSFNPNCTVNGTGSGASGSGTQLAVTTSVTFQPSFSGAADTYLLAYDNQGLNTTLQGFGTWTVTGSGGSGLPIRITPGGPYTDSQGQLWSADYGYRRARRPARVQRRDAAHAAIAVDGAAANEDAF